MGELSEREQMKQAIHLLYEVKAALLKNPHTAALGAEVDGIMAKLNAVMSKMSNIPRGLNDFE